MRWSTKSKNLINRLLAPLNLHLTSLTAARDETIRLQDLGEAGHFDKPVFPVPERFVRCDPLPIFDALDEFRGSTGRFAKNPKNGTSFSFDNAYFTSPDAEVAYAVVRRLRPKHIVEVGSGNSSRLFHAAIADGCMQTRLTAIDPHPRSAIDHVADEVITRRLEEVPLDFFGEKLDANDVLFIDSSHQVRVGNDVLKLLLCIVPALRGGVVIHLHDIFLPFDYPRQWMIEYRWDWAEQYLVQAMLQSSDRFDVMWPGHFLQRTLTDFSRFFDVKPEGVASSLWLRKRP
jgi:hypothetical protein